MRDEVNAYKKELILRAAAETFYERGYHETTVDILTEKLSGTKAIFYYYYTDKHAVLEEIYRRSLTTAQAVVQRAIDEGGSPVVMLSSFARYYAQWVIDNQLIVGVFWREERSLSQEARAAVAVEQKKFDDMVAGIIKEGIASGEFAADDVRMASRAISGMISFTYTWWRGDRRLNRDDAANYYADMALRMAGAAQPPVTI
jgi:AcrR family transcriptional regulator